MVNEVEVQQQLLKRKCSIEVQIEKESIEFCVDKGFKPSSWNVQHMVKTLQGGHIMMHALLYFQHTRKYKLCSQFQHT